MALQVIQIDWDTGAQRCQAIREQVFIREQHIPFELEMDGKDPACLHVLATDGSLDIGTARLLPDAHVGRVAVLASHRGQGIGVAIMQKVAELARARGDRELHLASQASAIPFYLRLGYQADGPRFMEAGIPHQNMTLRL